MKIFVVEDEPSIRRFYREALKPEGYEVVEASTFEEARRKIEQGEARSCEVAVVDGYLGHHQGDGKEIVELLRAKVSGIRVMVCSGQESDWGDINLMKPIHIEDLLNAVSG